MTAKDIAPEAGGSAAKLTTTAATAAVIGLMSYSGARDFLTHIDIGHRPELKTTLILLSAVFAFIYDIKVYLKNIEESLGTLSKLKSKGKGWIAIYAVFYTAAAASLYFLIEALWKDTQLLKHVAPCHLPLSIVMALAGALHFLNGLLYLTGPSKENGGGGTAKSIETKITQLPRKYQVLLGIFMLLTVAGTAFIARESWVTLTDNLSLPSEASAGLAIIFFAISLPMTIKNTLEAVFKLSENKENSQEGEKSLWATGLMTAIKSPRMLLFLVHVVAASLFAGGQHTLGLSSLFILCAASIELAELPYFFTKEKEAKPKSLADHTTNILTNLPNILLDIALSPFVFIAWACSSTKDTQAFCKTHDTFTWLPGMTPIS
jgi:hypothetical protein